MLSANQIQLLIAENENIQQQLQETHALLAKKEQELLDFEKAHASTAELKSRLDIQLEELQMLHFKLNKQQQKTAGAEQREFELNQEITTAIEVQHAYTDLQRDYNYICTQLADAQDEIAALKKKNATLQKIAVQVGELESTVENLNFERDILLEKLEALEKPQV
jgi:DNA repair ATPase RecN